VCPWGRGGWEGHKNQFFFRLEAGFSQCPAAFCLVIKGVTIERRCKYVSIVVHRQVVVEILRENYASLQKSLLSVYTSLAPFLTKAVPCNDTTDSR
jgi:hypothetical protein